MFYSSFSICHSSFTICHSSFIICYLSFIIRHLSLIICHLSFIICYSSFIICYSSFVIQPSSFVTQLSLFANAFLCFSSFLIFIVNPIHLSFTWLHYILLTLSLASLTFEVFIWSGSWKNDPSLCSSTSQLIDSVSTFFIFRSVDLCTSNCK